jgi:signal transduction histidine kinase
MLKSMRSRMTTWFVVLLIPFLLVTSYFLVTVTRAAAENDAQQALDKVRDRAVKAMKDPAWKDELEKIAEDSAVRNQQIGIIVRDLHRDPIWHAEPNLPPLDLVKQPKSEQEKWRFSGKRVSDVQLGPKQFGLVQLVLLQKKRPTNRTLPNLMLGLSAIVIGAVGTGAWFMVGGVLSPLKRLSKQAGQASAEHLSVRLEAPSRDVEMVNLVDTLNGLLDRVYETAEIKGRFYAAASHELRTPLQALSGHLELANSRKRTADEYEAVVKESYTQTRRLIALVQGLLFLHQIDSRTNSPQEPVNLSESCENALELMFPLLRSRNLQLKESFEPNLRIEAVPSHAEVLARNLIENAVKYGTEGGEISISLRQEDEQILLEVINDYPENIKIATENVFEAFYRDDTSRNSKTGGNGLGLAICRAISTANGWTVSLHQESGKIRATVNFGAPEAPKDSKPKRKPASGTTRAATA